jgi:DNA-binding transcriptional MerR regulator
MTIKDVCKKYDITPDTLRYYERVGVIPEVNRTAGGIRDYTDDDLKWVQNAICLRDAGVPIEMLIEYVRLFQSGDETLEARCNLLKEAREEILAARAKYDEALNKLDYKISMYEKAIVKGELIWEEECCKKDKKHG